MDIQRHSSVLGDTVEKLSDEASYKQLFHAYRDEEALPSGEVLKEIIDLCRAILFPGYYGNARISKQTIRFHTGVNVETLHSLLSKQVYAGLCFADTSCVTCPEEKISAEAEAISEAFISTLPEIRGLLATDVEATFNGDPAAQNLGEVIFCYPGFRAIGNYRIAHQLYKLGVPYIPRMITEMAHSETGIDIHPGAKIGHHFSIDHGTGTVIGETSVVGDYEKAIEAFDFALTCDDSDTELKILKAYCLYMNESYEKAIEEYQEIEGDEEVMRRISPLMAECYMKLEQYEKAYQLLSTIINDPDMEDGPTNYINYIRCCTETERDNEASIMLFKAAQLYPNNVRLLSLLALCLLDSGKKEEAIAITNKIFKIIDKKSINPETQEECNSLLHAGQYLLSKGDVDKAISYYKKVLQINPKTPMIHIHLAMAYLDNRDMENFMEHIGQISGDDLLYLLRKVGPEVFADFTIDSDKEKKHIQPEDLVKEFLKNKDNSN